MKSAVRPAVVGQNQVVSNMRGDRAFDKKSNKIVCHEPSFAQRVVVFALAAGMLGVLSTPSQAAPQPAAKHGYTFHHRSIWAQKWAAAHPAEEAAYQRKVASKYAWHPARRWGQPHAPAGNRWAPRSRVAGHAWGTPAKGHWRHGRHWGRRWSAAIAPASVAMPISAQSFGQSAGGVQPSAPMSGGVGILSSTSNPAHVNIIPSSAPATVLPLPKAAPIVMASTQAPSMPAKKPIMVAKADVRVADNGDNEESSSSPNVSLDFVAADINDVIKSLAMQTHTNIVSGADVKGNITVTLTHVSLDEALDMITKLSGYSYAKVGHTYVVGSPASIQALTTSGTASVAPTTAVLTLTYSDMAQMTTSIKDRYPNVKVTMGNSVGNISSGGVLLVTGTDDDISGVKALVQASEEALAHGVANSHTTLYHIKYASAMDLMAVLSRLVPSLVVTPAPTQGFDLSAPTTADAGGTSTSTAAYGSGAAGGAGGASTSTSSNGSSTTTSSSVAVKSGVNALLLTGSDLDIKRAKDLLEQVDYRPAQITYEAKITELNLNDTKNLGINWDFSGATTRVGESVKLVDPKTGAPLADNFNKQIDPLGPVIGDNGYLGKVLKFGTFGRTAVSNFLNVTLDALFKNGNAKLLSDPNISAVDGQQAAVFIGDAVRYVSSITQTQTGPTVTTDTVNVGIKLFVAGKASDDGYVTVNIHPEVSVITGYLAVPGGGSLPQVSSREATTTVRVKDGDYIAIGGLITDQDVRNMSKVPFLGDLPFFGNLFKDSTHSHQRNEVVIFVKVSVQKDQQTAEATPEPKPASLATK